MNATATTLRGFAPRSSVGGGDPNGLAGSWGAALLLLLLAAAPLPNGCVDPQWRAGYAGILCALGCAALATLALRGTRLSLSPGTVPLLLLVLLAMLQVLPWRESLDATTREVLGVDTVRSCSLIPARTLSRARELLALLVVFVLGSVLLADARRMHRAAWTLLLVGTVAAVDFLAHPFLEIVPNCAAPAGERPLTRHVFGTYLNRNHLAALFVMAILAGVGLVVSRGKVLNHRAPDYARRQTYVVAMLLVLGAALLRSGSRGAVLGLLVGLATFAFLLGRRRPIRHRAARLLATAGCVGLVAAALPDELWARFATLGEQMSTDGTRLLLWRSALLLFARFPLLGCGFGTYADLSALTQVPEVRGHIAHAHCDPLELMVEGGVVGVQLVAGGMLVVGAHLLRRTRAARGDRRTFLACGFTAALAALGAHATVDFDLQIPALALWAAALGGAASGAMARAHALPAVGATAPAWSTWPAMVALGLGAVFALREASAAHLCDAAVHQRNTELALRTLATAEQLHAGSGAAAVGAAFRLLRDRSDHGHTTELVVHAERALHLNPFDRHAAFLLAVGTRRLARSDAPVATRRAELLVAPSERAALRGRIAALAPHAADAERAPVARPTDRAEAPTPDAPLRLTPGRCFAAARVLHPVDRRAAPTSTGDGVRIAPGPGVAANIRCSEPGGELLLTATGAPLRVQLDGTTLRTAPCPLPQQQRFRLPADSDGGRLEITVAGNRAAWVRELVLLSGVRR